MTQAAYADSRLAVVNCAKAMAKSGLITGTAGNVSVRTADGRMAITPTGVPYDSLSAEDICVLDFDGTQVAGNLKPSSEVPLHLAVYKSRLDVGAVVHTHSLYATAFAVANRPIRAVHYVIVTMGDEIPVVPYYLFGSRELAAAVAKGVDQSRGLLLQNHGVLALGDDLSQALYHAETIEYLAQLQYLAESLGSPKILDASAPVKNEVEKGAIRKFAEAIGDRNPLYQDEQYAKQSRYGSIIAPPTFSRTFDYGVIEGLDLPHDGLIHGEQSFEYHRPIKPGDVLYCSSKLIRVSERKGRLGKMVFLVFEHATIDSSDRLVVKETSTVIYREASAHE